MRYVIVIVLRISLFLYYCIVTWAVVISLSFFFSSFPFSSGSVMLCCLFEGVAGAEAK